MSYSLHLISIHQTHSHVFQILSHYHLNIFPCCGIKKKNPTSTAEVITERMTAALLGWLFLLADVQWAPRLATKTV